MCGVSITAISREPSPSRSTAPSSRFSQRFGAPMKPTAPSDRRSRWSHPHPDRSERDGRAAAVGHDQDHPAQAIVIEVDNPDAPVFEHPLKGQVVGPQRGAVFVDGQDGAGIEGLAEDTVLVALGWVGEAHAEQIIAGTEFDRVDHRLCGGGAGQKQGGCPNHRAEPGDQRPEGKNPSEKDFAMLIGLPVSEPASAFEEGQLLSGRFMPQNVYCDAGSARSARARRGAGSGIRSFAQDRVGEQLPGDVVDSEAFGVHERHEQEGQLRSSSA